VKVGGKKNLIALGILNRRNLCNLWLVVLNEFTAGVEHQKAVAQYEICAS
jgi:hypothetical protein